MLVGGKCHIGNDCMLSSGITIWANDSHRLMDADTGELLNDQPQGVLIGDHCWIRQGATFTKNAIIPANTVVGLPIGRHQILPGGIHRSGGKPGQGHQKRGQMEP